MMGKISNFFCNSKPYQQLVGLLFFLLLGFLLTVGLTMLFPDHENPNAALLVQGCGQLLTFLLPAVLFAIFYKSEPLSYFKVDLHGRMWFLGLVSLVILLMVLPAMDWVSYWNDSWNFGQYESVLRQSLNTDASWMLASTSIAGLVFQLFIVAFIPALCEELFFRGALQQINRDWFGNDHVAILVTALCFALFHGDLYGLVPRFLLGVLLGYLFFLSGSILVNVAFHFGNNALVVVMYFLYHRGVQPFTPDDPLMMSWTIVVPCLIAAAILFVLYFVKKSPNQASK